MYAPRNPGLKEKVSPCSHHEVPKALLVLLREHGFHTALDLRLLDQRGQETAELMDQLRLGGVSIGHRSKVRLLLGDNHHGGGDIRTTSDCGEPKTMARISADRGSHCRRQLQDASSSSDGGGMSADTIAIVLSVLVGAAGYLVQVRIGTLAIITAFVSVLQS
eukprot:SAG31_NODE_57_length_29727_cov_12.584568_10_plen_163_part_00